MGQQDSTSLSRRDFMKGIGVAGFTAAGALAFSGSALAADKASASGSTAASGSASGSGSVAASGSAASSASVAASGGTASGSVSGSSSAGVAATFGSAALTSDDSLLEGIDATKASSFKLDGFSSWALGGHASGAQAWQFLSGEENRPSDDEVTQILRTANTYFQCHGLTGTHYIVVKDAAEQADVMKFMKYDGTGTVMLLVCADGLRDQDHHAEEYFPGPSSENGGNPEYWQMHYGIFEAGMATAYLNLAARELGYRIRCFGALNIVNADSGEVAPYATGGNFQSIQSENWDIAKYMQPKEDGDAFDHYCMVLDDNIQCAGNVNLICAVLIGKVDETPNPDLADYAEAGVDTATGATATMSYKGNIRDNFDFWDK